MFYALFNLPQLTHYFTTKCFSKQLIHPWPTSTTHKRTIVAHKHLLASQSQTHLRVPLSPPWISIRIQHIHTHIRTSTNLYESQTTNLQIEITMHLLPKSWTHTCLSYELSISVIILKQLTPLHTCITNLLDLLGVSAQNREHNHTLYAKPNLWNAQYASSRLDL